MRLLTFIFALLALGGCAVQPTSAPVPVTVAPGAAPAPVPAATPPSAAASAPSPAAQRSATVSTLAIERQWLASWFKGTPVVVAQRDDGAVTVDVPRQFCFERGKETLKPALVAVLDKVAESLRRVPLAELRVVAAPGDVAGAVAGGTALGQQRAVRVQDHLRSKGVPAARLGKPSVAPGMAVQLRIEPSSPA
jgi:outer membrane protein OmpA-like peptidoglycan-associated protein